MFKREVRRFFYNHIDKIPQDATTVKVIIKDRDETQEDRFKFTVTKKNSSAINLNIIENGDIAQEDIVDLKNFLYKQKNAAKSRRILGGRELGIANIEGNVFTAVDIGNTFHYATDAIYKYFWVKSYNKGALDLVTPMDKIDLGYSVPNDLDNALGRERYTWEQHRFDDPSDNVFTKKLLELFKESGNGLSGLYKLTMHNSCPAFYNDLYVDSILNHGKVEYKNPYYIINETANEAVIEVINHFGTNIKEVLLLAQFEWTFNSEYVQGYYSTTCEDGETLLVFY
jgi:hypothetical protein